MKNKKKSKHTGRKLLFYIGGLLIMTLGVAISVKSDLGVSPVSSIPYTITCVAGMDLGIATILFSIFMVFLQAVLLRKQFKISNLLQLPAGILFGIFLTFCCNLMIYFPDPSGTTVKLILMLISTVIVAAGVFLYVPAGFIPLAPEGAMLAVCKKTGFKFANVKLCFDISMVVISGVTCLLVINELGSVGIGTLLAAVLVGTEVKIMTKFFGDVRDKFLGLDDEDVKADVTPLMDIMKKDVYTISCDAPVIDALRLMRDKKVSGCPVIDNENNLVGFISDGDIIRQLTSEHSLFVNSHSFEKIQFNNSLSNMITKKVSEFATQKIITVNINDDLDEVCYKLGENRLKKAPVMENGKMVGIINVSNIIKYAADLMEKEM